MHKNPHQNAGNGIKETLFFKIFLGGMPPDPPRGSRAFDQSQANSCPPPPPKVSKPVRLCSSSPPQPSFRYMTRNVSLHLGLVQWCIDWS